MQISSLVGQYNSSTATAAEGVSPTKGVETLVAATRSLTKGNIFEGTINYSKNGQVVLGLSNGQQIAARLADSSLKLMTGESMFFQVRANDGEQIQIAPYKVAGAGANLTLISALSAAGLPMEGDYLSMVDKMMQEQMPIDKNSLNQMAKLVLANKEANVSTLVEMKKLDIPITKEMVAQYENYQKDGQSIMKGISDFIDSIPNAMTNDTLSADALQTLNRQMLSVITEGLSEQVFEAVIPETDVEAELIRLQNPSEKMTLADSGMQNIEGNPSMQNALTGSDLNRANENITQANGTQGIETSIDGTQVNAETGETSLQEEQLLGEDGQVLSAEAGAETSSKEPVVPHSLGSLFSKSEIAKLDSMLRDVVWNTSEEHMEFLDSKDSVVSVLNKLQRAFAEDNKVEKDALLKLMNSPEAKKLLKDALEQQWLVKPTDVKGDTEKISKLYEKLERQLNQMEQAVKASGQSATEFVNMSSELKNNVDFMNQINQFYQYVQIPLKMSGQNAAGELFVYTNRKDINDPNKELSAFLHLDMDHLGSTDISVKMLHKDVNTKFYMSSDESYALVLKHWPVLEERLKKKGYAITVDVLNEGKSVNVVEDLLKKDMPVTNQVKRYSFDIRA